MKTFREYVSENYKAGKIPKGASVLIAFKDSETRGQLLMTNSYGGDGYYEFKLEWKTPSGYNQGWMNLNNDRPEGTREKLTKFALAGKWQELVKYLDSGFIEVTNIAKV